jgi:hypothetical protein
MKFDKDHEIFSRINVRPYCNDDFNVVSDIIKSQPTMFGTKIENYWAGYISSVTQPRDLGLTVIGEIDNEIKGVMRINFWGKMPFWHIGSNFTLRQTGLDYIKHRALSLAMYTYCMQYAESEKRYDGYIIITDLGENFKKRKLLHDKLMPTIQEKYIVNDVEIIKPFEKSKYEAFNVLLGRLSGKNERAIVIRHNSLKSEFRSY